MQHHKNWGLTYCKQLIANKEIHTMCTLVHRTTNFLFQQEGNCKTSCFVSKEKVSIIQQS